MKTNIEQININGKEYKLTLIEKQADAVNVRTQEQWDFVTMKQGYKWLYGDSKFENYKNNSAISLRGELFFATNGAHQEIKVISFKEYLELKGFKKDWQDYIMKLAKDRYKIGCTVVGGSGETFQVKKLRFGYHDDLSVFADGDKASLSTVVYNVDDGCWDQFINDALSVDDLVMGEIYVSYFTHLLPTIFRKGGCAYDCNSGGFIKILGISSNLKKATDDQEKTLIKAELGHGLVWHNGEYLD